MALQRPGNHLGLQWEKFQSQDKHYESAQIKVPAALATYSVHCDFTGVSLTWQIPVDRRQHGLEGSDGRSCHREWGQVTPAPVESEAGPETHNALATLPQQRM